MRFVRVIAVLAFATAPALADDKEKGDTKVAPVLNFKMKGIDGKDVELSKLQGKVVMFVNVASKCGLTPQYDALEKLHEKYSKDGLVIVGVPANEFGKQEPGTDAEIKEFCTSNYGVKFTMLSKVVVKGKGICPLYEFLTGKDTNPNFAGPIKWNFEKFIVGRSGEVIARFEPTVKPEEPKVVEAIEAELKKK
jgi:glutathione peroxidase